VFLSFCRLGKGSGAVRDRQSNLNCSQFAKLCSECGLYDEVNFGSYLVNCVFARAKEKFSRHLGYVGFLDALDSVANCRQVR
jgi:hypothetical protein